MIKKTEVSQSIILASFGVFLLGMPTDLLGQNYGSVGQSWSSTWGFQSPTDRSLALQQAQAIRQAENPSGPSSIINSTTYNNTSYDNRSSYQEILGSTGALGPIDFQLNGDRIGQNTNSIGAMNTGTTNIDIVGDSNAINATNAADSNGCIDGSIQEYASSNSDLVAPAGLNLGTSTFGRDTSCDR